MNNCLFAAFFWNPRAHYLEGYGNGCKPNEGRVNSFVRHKPTCKEYEENGERNEEKQCIENFGTTCLCRVLTEGHVWAARPFGYCVC